METAENIKKMLEQEKIKRCQVFNTELEVLLTKYNVSLVSMIQIVGNQVSSAVQIQALD